MTGYRVLRSANARLDEIYDYTADRWGELQADAYLSSLFKRFDAIASKEFTWRAISAEFGVSGFVCKYERHFIYWKVLNDGTVRTGSGNSDRCYKWMDCLEAA